MTIIVEYFIDILYLFIVLLIQIKYESIKSGGGTWPNETQQPVISRC
jgi:hypothetical protein